MGVSLFNFPGIEYVSEPTGVNVISISGNVMSPVDKLNTEHLKNVVEGCQVSTEGTVQQLWDRMKDIIKKSASEHQKAKHNTKKVLLSQDVDTSSICSMTESIIVSVSDTEQHFYTTEFTSDGVATFPNSNSILNAQTLLNEFL